MGFNAPSKIQETALPALLADPLVIFCCFLAGSLNSDLFCASFAPQCAKDSGADGLTGWAVSSTVSKGSGVDGLTG